MPTNREAESVFELFCEVNGIPCMKIPETDAPTPDFEILVDGNKVYVEVKQLDESDGFDEILGIQERVVGMQVRKKIDDARKQVQPASREGHQAILLIHNNLDPLQLFATEPEDFVAAMYGELTLATRRDGTVDVYHGRNANLQNDKNTSFSAIGHLRTQPNGPTVTLYENLFARHPLRACQEITE